MTTPAHRVEARQASTVFHALLIQQGLQGAAEAMDSFDDVQPVPGRAASSSGKWLARVLASLVKRRGAVGRMAAAYYRYMRALHTGYTYPPLDGVSDEDESLNDLRDDFFSQVETMAPDLLTKDRELVDDDGEIVTDPPPKEDEDVKVEGDKDYLKDLLDDLAAPAEDIMHDELLNSGPVVLDSKLRGIDDEAPAKVVDKKRDEAHQQAAARVAAAAERNVLNAGREFVHETGQRDERVIGYVRVSGTGHPCGWCAMLISRGAVLYKTTGSGGRRTAVERTSDKGARRQDEKYHPNCHCYSEPVFSGEQYEEDPRFDLNRELDALWGPVTRGLRGDAAISKWRKFIRDDWKSPGSAQVAGLPTTHAQEA